MFQKIKTKRRGVKQGIYCDYCYYFMQVAGDKNLRMSNHMCSKCVGYFNYFYDRSFASGQEMINFMLREVTKNRRKMRDRLEKDGNLISRYGIIMHNEKVTRNIRREENIYQPCSSIVGTV